LKSLVIKTILITLASVIGALMVIFGALCLFAPATVAGFFDDVGNYSASVFFYEKEYERTGDINGIVLLIDKSYGQRDSIGEEKYLEKLLSHKDFETFCKKDGEDKKLENVEYYYGYYTSVLIENQKLDSAISVGKKYVEKYTYSQNNPFRILAKEYADGTDEQKDLIKNAILDLENIETIQNVYITQDIIKLS